MGLEGAGSSGQEYLSFRFHRTKDPVTASAESYGEINQVRDRVCTEAYAHDPRPGRQGSKPPPEGRARPDLQGKSYPTFIPLSSLFF